MSFFNTFLNFSLSAKTGHFDTGGGVKRRKKGHWKISRASFHSSWQASKRKAVAKEEVGEEESGRRGRECRQISINWLVKCPRKASKMSKKRSGREKRGKPTKMLKKGRRRGERGLKSSVAKRFESLLFPQLSRLSEYCNVFIEVRDSLPISQPVAITDWFVPTAHEKMQLKSVKKSRGKVGVPYTW